MGIIKNKSTRIGLTLVTVLGVAVTSTAFAQDQQQNPAPNGGWRKFGDAPNVSANQAPPPNAQNPGYDPNQGPPPAQNYPQNNAPNYPPNYTVPAQLTIRPGTYITVRIEQTLSSDRNQAGDAFTASLARPVVVDGVVVAQPGQTVGGHVVEAQKAGRVEGTSKLGVQLTDLTLVDGQPVTLQSQLISRTAPTSVGRDAAAIGGTTALGAAIGAAAGWGRGAAIGAGAGAVAGTLGVLLTRGHPTIIYPESMLTFRVEAPVTFSTERAPQAFRYVETGEYDRPNYADNGPRPAGGGYAYGAPPPAPYYGYGAYSPYYYPYYYGSGLGFTTVRASTSVADFTVGVDFTAVAASTVAGTSAVAIANR